MRNLILALIAVAAVALSCQSEDLLAPGPSSGQEGYVTVNFRASVPEMEVLKTKAVDPDGEAITKLVLFCFNERGLFISTEEVIPTTTGDFTGNYEAEIPVVTDRVHFVANFHKAIDKDELVGKSESEVLSTMVGSSGMMSYWARVEKGSHPDIKTAFESDYQTIHLLRDHARVTVTDVNGTYNAADLAFVVINTNAFGTVAPFQDGNWVAPSLTNRFVTLPDSDAKVTGNTEVVAKSEREYQYVFETENSSEDPVYVIVRATKNGVAKYYRIMLIDSNGEYVPVMRNFTYNVQITGEMDYGQDTFQAALEAPVTNNVWVSVSDDVNEVRSTEYVLSVKETHIVLGADDPVFSTTHRKYAVYYTLKALTGTLTDADQPVISWLDGNTVAQHTLASSAFTISADGKTAEGVIEVTLLAVSDTQQKLEGTLLIKKGLLERKVNIITVARQKFTPAWITTNVYGGATGSNVTMMFHISKDCPEALFPIDVLVSVNDMDVRNASGMVLPVITKDDSRYGSYDNGIGYKYLLTVNEPGDQRVYLETILEHQQGDNVSVTIEAKNFETLTKTATFQDGTDNRILIHNLRTYVAATPADEYIYYYLVPQKIHAEVEFDTYLGKVVNTAPAEGKGITLTNPDNSKTHFEYIAPNADFTTPDVDEFLLYSQNLEHNHDKPSGTTYYFDFCHIDASKWSPTAGRVMGLYRNSNESDNPGATLHLRTTTPKADEVVRIASNTYGQVSVTTGTKGSFAKESYTSATSTGTGTYKSAIFELVTFHPFHFSAQVKQGSTVLAGGVETPANAMKEEYFNLGYAPGQSVNVEFDITSFKSDIYIIADSEQLSVDPFGTAFEVYIDAPTLELDEAAVAAAGLSSKIRKDPKVAGRVIYTVDASRETERGFSSVAALSTDNAVLDLFRKPVTVNQNGERKVIPFKTKDIVSAGEITISSDETKVVYYKKTFNIENAPMAGTLKYNGTAVPAGTFVPFSTDDGTRIGVVTVGNDGTYTLRLRAEYDFTWDSTPVKFECKIAGTEYSCRFDSLAALAAASTVNMN